MLSKFLFYHGVALCRLIHCDLANVVKLYPSPSNSSYMINDDTGVFIKHCANRMSPWSFTFSHENRSELSEMTQLLKKVFVVLVCGEDGIVCLSAKEIEVLLDYGRADDQWIRIRRRMRESYTVEGSNGRLAHKIADSSYPEKMFAKVGNEVNSHRELSQ